MTAVVEVTRPARRERMVILSWQPRLPTFGTTGIQPDGSHIRHVAAVTEKVLYFAAYVVTDPGETPLVQKQILSEAEY